MPATSVDCARVAFDLIDDIDRTQTPEQAVERLASALSVFDYRAFLITGVPEPPQRVEPYFLANGWPRGWSDGSGQEGYHIDDPAAAWRQRPLNPFEWSGTAPAPEAWPNDPDSLLATVETDGRRRVLVPIIRASGSNACVTMAGERPELEPKVRRAIQLVSVYAHAKAVSLIGCDKAVASARELTAREREALQWTAAGKSSWEISVILGISERTVNWLIARATEKLNAVNRTQAVVNAIRAGQIQL